MVILYNAISSEEMVVALVCLSKLKTLYEIEYDFVQVTRQSKLTREYEMLMH